MIIIDGLEAARKVLARPSFSRLYSPSPALKERLTALFEREISPQDAVAQIANEVAERGDAAVYDYTLRIDRVELTTLEVSRQQISDAYRLVGKKLIASLQLAADRIRSFHARQKRNLWASTGGLNQGWMMRPLRRVGVYAPGGTASYPSTVLMTAIPAKVAGVEEVILVTPPGPQGAVPAATLVAADLAGVSRVFSIGGAQAIAALAYGTESIPRVDKICGPGNIFVVLAKKMVYGAVDIDGLQGPSELLIVADETANPRYCAADLLAQAEHDPLASAIMITTSRGLASDVNREVEQQLATLPRRAIVTESLNNGGMIVLVATMDEAMELANLYAPEHLYLMVNRASAYVDKVTNAGAIFLGKNSTVVLGDYVVGPSHVLPTGGTARFGSPLNVSDFVKFTNLVNIDDVELKQLGQTASIIARAEGLEAHARAAESRLR